MTLTDHMVDGMRIVELVLDEQSAQAGVTPAYLNAGGACTAKHWKKSIMPTQRQKGWMRIEVDGASEIVAVQYFGRGKCKDVLETENRCKLLGGVHLVFKVVPAKKIQELQGQALTWEHQSLADWSPMVCGLEGSVPMRLGTWDSHNFVENVSVLAENILRLARCGHVLA